MKWNFIADELKVHKCMPLGFSLKLKIIIKKNLKKTSECRCLKRSLLKYNIYKN